MKKLKHDLKVGDRFILAPWGWQCAEVPRGEYEIIEMPEGDDCTIKQVNGNAKYYISFWNLEYFCGEEVEHKYNVVYNLEDYQPSGDDENDPDFVKEEPGEFGVWHLGRCGDQQRISSIMLNTDFAWVEMPW
jgi:hypothetical protein